MAPCTLVVLLALLALASCEDLPRHHHHHHHRGHHRHQGAQHNASGHEQTVATAKITALASPEVSDGQIVAKLRKLEQDLDRKEQVATTSLAKGHLNVNGPLPVDFSDRFAQGVADATGCRAADVELLGALPMPKPAETVEEVFFRSRSDVVAAVADQAADPKSKLVNGVLHSFLVARDESETEPEAGADQGSEDDAATQVSRPAGTEKPEPSQAVAAAPEVDMAMPYGDLEPFGREDTAQELTESSIRESNAMVDQLERAEVAEEKRAVFRALTRLRGAAITSFDGIARSQTGNIDDYARSNQWRQAHPVHHLAAAEADVSKWAFPEDREE